MANLNISFGGQILIVPGSYYIDIVTPTQNPGQFTLPLIYIGYAYNGGFGATGLFNTPGNLLSYIRGGPASAYVSPMTLPSPSLAGSNNIFFINVGSNTAASLVLNNSLPSGAITLTTTTSGVPSNLTQAEVVAGNSYSGVSSNLTLYDGYANTTLTGNNLGVPFQIAYVGDAATASYSITGPSGAVTGMTLSSSTAGQSFQISLGPTTYATVSQVVEYINGTGFWVASLISDTQGLLSSQLLSPTGSTSLATGVTGAPFSYAPVVSIPYDAAFWVNQFANSIASATVSASASTSSPLAQIPLTHLSGATSAPPTNSSYASGFNIALNYPGWIVFADSNATAVQTLGAQHAETASLPSNGQNRRFFTGSSVGDSVATTLANAAALNSITSCYVYPGIQVVNTNTGLTQTMGGLYAAAAAAGIAASNQVALPLTNKPLNGVGVEVNLTLSQINQLQIGGVMPIALGGANNNVPTILSDQTCWQVDNNPLNALTQQVACRWWLAYTMRAAAQPYVGAIASPTTLTALLNAMKAALNASIYTDGSNGVLTSWDSSALGVVYSGAVQTAYVTGVATTVGQFRFITETITVQLYNAALSA